MRRLDLFPECHDGSPIDVFTAECCMRCVNPECTRSSNGTSKFDVRVNTWYDRLFENVPRMDQGDSRFATIAGKKFLGYNQPLTVPGSWTDPRDLEVAAPEPKAPPVASVPAPLVVAKTTQEAPAKPAIEAPTPVPTDNGKLPAHLALSNTPAQKGQMIKPPGVAAPDKSSRSWDAPLPSSDTEGVKIVQPGAKVRIR